MEILYRSSLNSKTNSGDLAKQYFTVVKSDKEKHDTTLIIKKYVLTNDFDLYENQCHEFKMVKEFKGKRLYFTGFSMKYKTFVALYNDILENGKI